MKKKTLTKSNSNVVFTGTLAGIAEYFGIEPTILRVIYVLITLFGIGSPILLYIALMIIIPSKTVTRDNNGYGHQNPYYQANNQGKAKKDVTNSVKKSKRKEANEDDWSDF